VFEHKSPNERILSGCERTVLVIFGAKTDWTGVEFDPGYPSTLTTEEKRCAQHSKINVLYYHLRILKTARCLLVSEAEES